MDSKKIVVKYNGTRYPRTVNLRKGTKTSFNEDRLVLELEEYDALYLLKNNSRLTPIKWEFTVVGEKETMPPPPPLESETDKELEPEQVTNSAPEPEPELATEGGEDYGKKPEPESKPIKAKPKKKAKKGGKK